MHKCSFDDTLYKGREALDYVIIVIRSSVSLNTVVVEEKRGIKMGRGKVELKRIENTTSRQVTFSKRRNGLLKKAFELSILCDAEVAVVIFSPSGKAYQFASHDMDRTIDRFKTEVGLPTSINTQRSRTAEFWRSEIEDLRKLVESLEARHKHLAGEELLSLGLKELKQLERQLKAGVERVRSRKRCLISEQINLLKMNHKALQDQNAYLQRRVKLQDAAATSRVWGGFTSNAV